MKYFFFIISVASTLFTYAQHLEQSYGFSKNDPKWVQLLYAKEPNLKQIRTAYKHYYSKNEFSKNQHTQYYKHFMRKYEPFENSDGTINHKTIGRIQVEWEEYNKQLLHQNQLKSGGVPNWEELGPWEYDHEAAMHLRTQSPGSAHVYTVEQSKSNPNTVYAGTATAGLWKSTDKGISWTLMTKNLLATEVQAIGLDPTNENIVYFWLNNKMMKSTDGGTTWNPSNTNIGFCKDIKIHPTNNQIILTATTNGLYRSTDAGVTFTKIMGGYMYEIEFHPTNPNIIYTIQSANNRTTFYKSTDAGITFTPKYNGWPGTGSSTNSSIEAIQISPSQHATLANNINLGNTAIPNFTIEVKIRSNGWSGDPAIISNKNWNSGANAGFILFGRGDGGVGFNIGNGSTRNDLGGGNINDGQWHNVAISYQANGDKVIYIDNIQIAKVNTVMPTNINSSLSTAIGQDGTLSYGSNFNGEIAEIRIFNTALDSTTIVNNYCNIANNAHPFSANLIHHYKIDENTGNTLNDSKGTNHATLTGTAHWASSTMSCTNWTYTASETQKRTEISVSPHNPNLVVALASGEVNGGSGLAGIYKSTDAGENFNFVCCGTGIGGIHSSTNKNILGYNGDLTASGGQYYYDLALDVSPTNTNRILAGGIMVTKSLDGGASWTRNNHWVTFFDTPAGRNRYVHADVHDIKFYQNGSTVDLWIASDGGLYYSSDQGETIEPRMHGIHGTDFWGFGSSLLGDAMIGGAYHNGTLRHFEHLYLKGKNGHGGWFGGGAGDAGDGYIHEADPRWYFVYGGLKQFPTSRLNHPTSLPYDGSKTPSYHTQSFSNYEWIPNQYEYYYVAQDSNLWLTSNNGQTWQLIHNFGSQKIYDVRIGQDNPNIIYVVHQTSGTNFIKKSVDAGITWQDITPSDALVGGSGYNANEQKNIDISHTDVNTIWCILRASSNIAKVLKSTDGGTNWTNITGNLLTNQRPRSIAHQQGTDGGIYVGTTNAIYYKNNTMPDFVLYNSGLPIKTDVNFQYPNYTYQKLRIASYRGAYQGDFYEVSQPIAKPSVNKIKTYCTRDTVYFKDLSFVSNVNRSRQWNFQGGTPASSTEANPKVIYSSPGTYTVSLTVTDQTGTNTKTLHNFIRVEQACDADSVPGKSLHLSASINNDLAVTNRTFHFDTTDFSLSCWIKTTNNTADASIMSDKDWDSGKNKGWILAMYNGKILFNIGDGTNRGDVSTPTTYNDGKWHYISVSADRDGLLSLYVDGVLQATINIANVGNIAINSSVYFGCDNELDYPFYGEIDEVKVWNTIISQDYFREQRHLTAKPLTDNHLIAYYQFNRLDSTILDRAGNNHADYRKAVNTISTAPIGKGVSHRQTITTGGLKTFGTTGASIAFANTGNTPDGELVVSRIDLLPDSLANNNVQLPQYWIINNYGNNTSFASLDSIMFKPTGSVSDSAATNPNTIKLYKRTDNEHLNNWNEQCSANRVYSGTNGYFVFANACHLNSFSQFHITSNAPTATILPVELLSFTATAVNNKEVQLNWTTTTEINLKEYEIQHATDGVNFVAIGIVNPTTPNSSTSRNYDFLHQTPIVGLNYYRLKIIDLDHSIEYSPIRSAEIKNDISAVHDGISFDIRVSPNPVNNGLLRIETNSAETLAVEVYNTLGQRNVSTSLHKNVLIDLSKLSVGIYHCIVKSKTEARHFKLIIE